ncbi:MAG: homoserine dehydrogenase [Lachnospiraceae bacterium]|jgi:homoserine dehydrogenase|nr:homoserine dehydrogenase [Lachnospiraceae bacterium]
MIKIAILGYGIVGSGVAEIIDRNKGEISARAGMELFVKHILDIRSFPGDPHEAKVTADFENIVNDPEISIITETMGGINPAYDYTKRALLAGKSVCTSNKELVAVHAPELSRIAAENGCHYLFEGSVGGGIPIIRTLSRSLTAERIESITGIINGTTNYILTKMEDGRADFTTVLKEAQELGYAEKDPEADIQGFDACRKLAILSSLMTRRHVHYEKIHTEGITDITAEDFRYAKVLDMTIKLLAMCSYDSEARLHAIVAPFLISDEHPLFHVDSVNNAICVHGNMLGDSMYYGRGAGKLPTASAILADVIECIRHDGHANDCFWLAEEMAVAPIAERSSRFLVRITKEEKKIQLASQLFKGYETDPNLSFAPGECAFACGPLTEKEFETACAALPGGIIGRIRIA